MHFGGANTKNTYGGGDDTGNEWGGDMKPTKCYRCDDVGTIEYSAVAAGPFPPCPNCAVIHTFLCVHDGGYYTAKMTRITAVARWCKVVYQRRAQVFCVSTDHTEFLRTKSDNVGVWARVTDEATGG